MKTARERRALRRPRPPIIRPPTPPQGFNDLEHQQSKRYKNFKPTSPLYNDVILSNQQKTLGNLSVNRNRTLSRCSSIDSDAGDQERVFHFEPIQPKPISPLARESRPISPLAREVRPLAKSSDNIFAADESAYESGSTTSNAQTEDSNNNHRNENRLNQNMKSRFRSEPILNSRHDNDDEAPLSPTTRHSHKRYRLSSRTAKLRHRALSVNAPADGQVEFTLYYDAEEKILRVNLVQLIELHLKAECFVGVLEIYDKEDKHERKKSTNVHLIRNNDNTLQLSDYADTGFFLYLTLLPNRNYCRHTAVVFGKEGVVFNERFTIHGQALDNMSQAYLCIHALCKFGRDSEPIVLGEVNVPLKRLQNSQLLPFMANLDAPSEEIEMEVFLFLIVSTITQKDKVTVNTMQTGLLLGFYNRI